MSCLAYIERDSVLKRCDPRLKVAAAFLLSMLISVCPRFPALGLALLLSAGLAVLARLPAGPASRRMLRLNGFMLLLWAVLPISTPGEPLACLGPFIFSREGAALAGAITLKGNAIVLIYTSLLSTIEQAKLGHALKRLHVPGKLVVLFLFTIRYIDILHHEFERLAAAMKTRGFRPRVSLHTYRTYGYLLAMLLTRSLDRAERIMEAMKCRGFVGKYHVLDELSFASRDAVFAIVSFAALVSLVAAAQL